MVQIECFNCRHKWPLGDVTTNRCPKCDWILEIYYDKAEADEVAKIYNEGNHTSSRAGVLSLIGIKGHAVAFPDQGRLAEIADKLVSRNLG